MDAINLLPTSESAPKMQVTLCIDRPNGLTQISLNVSTSMQFQDFWNDPRVKNILKSLNFNNFDFAWGVFGKKKPLTTELQSGDRIEIYQNLQCDPKEMRRLRARTRIKK